MDTSAFWRQRQRCRREFRHARRPLGVQSCNQSVDLGGGSSTVNQYGVYGTLGVSASANVPGARNSAVSWVDANGRFWLFGDSPMVQAALRPV